MTYSSKLLVFNKFRQLMIGAIACVLTLCLSSCAPSGQATNSVSSAQDAVLPINVGERAFVRPESMAQGLLKAGLTTEQALKFGPFLMEFIAAEGGAELHLSGQLKYAFAVFDDDLFITSTDKGFTLVRNAT